MSQQHNHNWSMEFTTIDGVDVPTGFICECGIRLSLCDVEDMLDNLEDSFLRLHSLQSDNSVIISIKCIICEKLPKLTPTPNTPYKAHKYIIECECGGMLGSNTDHLLNAWNKANEPPR